MVFDGESTVYSYENSGGISLFSVEPPEEGAIVGGSDNQESGSGATSTHIRWWIAYDESTSTYSGGITGVGWFRTTDSVHQNTSNYEGPFEQYTDEQIYRIALSSGGNLNSIFSEWNEKHSIVGDTTITGFVLFLQENPDATGCVTPGGATGG